LRWQIVVLVGLLVGCGYPPTTQERGPTRSVYTGDENHIYRFSQPETWDLFVLPDNLGHFQISGSELEAYVTADRGYIMSTNNLPHTDVIINAQVRQTAGAPGNGYGVVCRADQQGNGYYFLLASTGEFTISVGTSTRDALFELVPWQYHSIINDGFQSNEIRAVCAGDYLALFINDVFVAETTDYEFTSGELGVVIGAVGKPASVRFDNIQIRPAILR
jgi:hypothetical protein